MLALNSDDEVQPENESETAENMADVRTSPLPFRLDGAKHERSKIANRKDSVRHESSLKILATKPTRNEPGFADELRHEVRSQHVLGVLVVGNDRDSNPENLLKKIDSGQGFQEESLDEQMFYPEKKHLPAINFPSAGASEIQEFNKNEKGKLKLQSRLISSSGIQNLPYLRQKLELTMARLHHHFSNSMNMDVDVNQKIILEIMLDMSGHISNILPTHSMVVNQQLVETICNALLTGGPIGEPGAGSKSRKFRLEITINLDPAAN
ncbi:MAG: hypothetical protein DWQ05_03210 [Calditrichaeota bacterium]|nr:MAG: hypothetical protein DWQ05_03210 [Calditrichota bacterium]